jgi:endonuclease/exonuclease/phosphatase family metal-dependent hydrolase
MATPITAGAGGAPTAAASSADPALFANALPTSLNKIPCYGYDAGTQRWTSDLGKGHKNKTSTPITPDVLRISTMNILADCFPWVVKLAIDSDARFPALVKEVIKLDATFLGLNEMTTTSLGLLLADPWIQRNYFVSEIVPEAAALPEGATNGDAKKDDRRIPKGEPGHLISPHGCVLLSKIPFTECYEVPPYHGGPRSAIVGLFKVSSDIQEGGQQQVLGVCSIHTLAYQTHENKKKREVQLQLATQMGHKALDDYISATSSGSVTNIAVAKAGFVIMGDMNLHFVNEDQNVLDLDMVDAWAETHWGKANQDVPSDFEKANCDLVPLNVAYPGWTFDAQENTMIPRYIPGEKRKMRLDRILISEGSHLAFRNECQIWGNKPVDKKREVFLSDHYGLTVDMSVIPPTRVASASKSSTGEVVGALEFTEVAGDASATCSGPLYRAPEVSAILEANSKLPLDDHHFSKIHFTLGLIPHSLWLGMRWLGKW